MNLIKRHGSVEVLPLGSIRDPGLIGPDERFVRGDDRGGARRGLAFAGHGISLLREQSSVGTKKLVFVERAWSDARNEQLPDARLAAQTHRMSSAVPGVEVADNGHAARVGRPDGKADALDAADRHRLSPEAASELVMRTLGDQMQIEFAQQKAEAVWVFRLLNRIGPHYAQAVGAAANHRTGEEAAGMGELEATEEAGILARDHVDRLSARRERAHDRHRVAVVWTENRERIAMPPIDERLHGLCADPDEAILTDRHARRGPFSGGWRQPRSHEAEWPANSADWRPRS